jgi:hypothetical protein
VERACPSRVGVADDAEYTELRQRRACGEGTHWASRTGGKVFHSFRHGWKDAARAVMPEDHHDSITGHSNSVGRCYGRGVPLRVLAESMAKVRFAGR